MEITDVRLYVQDSDEGQVESENYTRSYPSNPDAQTDCWTPDAQTDRTLSGGRSGTDR